MLGAETDTTTLLAPAGFCPRCDYPMDSGTCPECGLEIDEARLRRRPKTWLRRHWRGVAVGLCALSALAWFANARIDARIDWIRLFPTSYLLSIHASESGSNEAATEELTRRYLAGSLTAEQTRSFIRGNANIRWNYKHYENENPIDPDGRRVHTYFLRNKIFVPSFPLWHNRAQFSIQEKIIEIRADGQEVPMTTRYSDEARYAPLVAFSTKRAQSPVTISRPRPKPPPLHSFFPIHIQLINREAACRTIEIDTQVVVVDKKTQKVVTQWQMTHTVVTKNSLSPSEPKPGTKDHDAAP